MCEPNPALRYVSVRAVLDDLKWLQEKYSLKPDLDISHLFENFSNADEMVRLLERDNLNTTEGKRDMAQAAKIGRDNCSQTKDELDLSLDFNLLDMESLEEARAEFLALCPVAEKQALPRPSLQPFLVVALLLALVGFLGMNSGRLSENLYSWYQSFQKVASNQSIMVVNTKVSSDLRLLNRRVDFQPQVGVKSQKQNYIDLSWQDDREASELLIEVSTEPSFNSVLESHQVSGTSLRWWPKLAGNYFWRVRAKEPEQDVFRTSKTGILNVLPHPPLFEDYYVFKKYGKTESQLALLKVKADINWPNQPLVEKWQVQVSQSPRFHKIVHSQEVSKSRFRYEFLRSGEYFIRVSPMGNFADGYKPSYSSTRVLISKDLKLRAPASRALLPLKSSRVRDPMQFEWEMLVGARNYEIQLSETPGFEAVYLRKLASRNKMVISKSAIRKASYWRVKAIYAEGHSKWSEPSQILLVDK